MLCSSNGEYEEGACRCYPGWKGAECSIRHNECEVPDCNNHGNCVAGECQCSRGYTGEFCQLGELSLSFLPVGILYRVCPWTRSFLIGISEARYYVNPGQRRALAWINILVLLQI